MCDNAGYDAILRILDSIRRLSLVNAGERLHSRVKRVVIRDHSHALDQLVTGYTEMLEGLTQV